MRLTHARREALEEIQKQGGKTTIEKFGAARYPQLSPNRQVKEAHSMLWNLLHRGLVSGQGRGYIDTFELTEKAREALKS